MYTVLVCDDDRYIASALEIYLHTEGYRVVKAIHGGEALDILRREEVHLILMDIMMPQMDGIHAATAIREFSNIPIIFLTAKGEDADKILGLNLGADDYVTKPFNPLELLARVKSQLRRYHQLGGSPANGASLTVGPISMNDAAKQVTLDGVPISLTPLEYNILKLFLSHPGQVFSSTQIYEQVWSDPAYGSETTVPVHIRHLREKLEVDPGDPRYLKVVWGLGYKLDAGPAPVRQNGSFPGKEF